MGAQPADRRFTVVQVLRPASIGSVSGAEFVVDAHRGESVQGKGACEGGLATGIFPACDPSSAVDHEDRGRGLGRDRRLVEVGFFRPVLGKEGDVSFDSCFWC